MEKIALPHQGWGNASVRVDPPPHGVASILEAQGTWILGGYSIFGLVDTPHRLEEGDMLCSMNFTRQRARAVIPRKYTHVKVYKSGGSGLVWWKLGFRGADTCPEALGYWEGSHPDVRRYLGPPGKAILEVKGRGYANLSRFTIEGSGEEVIKRVSCGPSRNVVHLPAGPVLLQVDCLVPWSLTIADMPAGER